MLGQDSSALRTKEKQVRQLRSPARSFVHNSLSFQSLVHR
jgi:hypothetical protein